MKTAKTTKVIKGKTPAQQLSKPKVGKEIGSKGVEKSPVLKAKKNA